MTGTGETPLINLFGGSDDEEWGISSASIQTDETQATSR